MVFVTRLIQPVSAGLSIIDYVESVQAYDNGATYSIPSKASVVYFSTNGGLGEVTPGQSVQLSSISATLNQDGTQITFTTNRGHATIGYVALS